MLKIQQIKKFDKWKSEKHSVDYKKNIRLIQQKVNIELKRVKNYLPGKPKKRRFESER